ncbi:MAG: hypothetical protein ACK4ND_17035 [Cytophagaceae bacterium]
MKLLKNSSFLLFLILFSHCQKEKLVEKTPSSKPEIKILSPEEGVLYEERQLAVKAVLSNEDDAIGDYSIQVLKLADGREEEVWSFADHAHVKEFSLDLAFDLPYEKLTNYKLSITARDHYENSSTKVVHFSGRFQVDRSVPMITVYSPAQGQNFHNRFIPININITNEDNDVKVYSLQVTNVATGAEVFKVEENVSSKEINVYKSFELPTSAQTNYLLIVKVTDSYGREALREVSFSGHYH